MLSLFDAFRDTSNLATILKLLLSVLCGTVIGLERSSKNRPAGFRTHILVCLGSCTAAMTGLFLYLDLKLPSDISRIASQVVAGLGFIGAGTIIVTKKLSIKGLTTAAGLWTTGIIGIAIGSGFFEAGIVGTVLVLLAETLFARLSMKITHVPQFTLELLYNEKDFLDQVLRFLKDHRMDIVNLQIHTMEAHDTARYSAKVELRSTMPEKDLLFHVQHMRGIVSATTL
ncbi:MAG: MgtC/SapB family protein [Clostridia bacterium]|nr:MgtC/SapB family protein [Clostridia bacterium]MBR1684019.1 MgtC/SapB family protein [Clostridia bacterium]